MKSIIITITILLISTVLYAQDYSSEIAQTHAEITRLESQKRLSEDMEPPGLRRTIAQKKERLTELYMMQRGATAQDIQLRRQQKQLDRIEDKVDSIR